ncbi:MAG: FAD-binding oxidoreductase [Bacteroidetes bacterium]|nr:MAG: FAD-binding oxidoreductase [Bacteroidota bacterium]
MKVSNWGNYPVIDAPVKGWERGAELNSASAGTWIPRGMGRCYGDASLGALMLSTEGMKRFLAFDESTGLLTCEAGVTFADLIEWFLPRGWFPPVTPGTKFVSLGGALASDVHGKNHHVEGSISRHVEAFSLLTAQGERLHCSRTQHPEVFFATMGGMGLTGLIETITLRLRRVESAWIQTRHLKARHLGEIVELFDAHERATYSVAWIDCLSGGTQRGRSILMLGEHAPADQVPGSDPLRIPAKLPLTVPFHLPGFSLNRYTIGFFNTVFYHKQRQREVRQLSTYENYFYPLDFIHHWNRIYGRRGFTQYQFVVPREAGSEVLPLILDRIRSAGLGSFLAVLKQFGPPDEGYLSFPMPGYTLALDFPLTRWLFPFLEELDAIIASYGGRVYLTKDVRLKPEMLGRMYPQLDVFRSVLQRLDPAGKVQSLQSRRLGIHNWK